MAFAFMKFRIQHLGKVPVRHKRGPDHWLSIKNKKTSSNRALEHFDDFYGNVYGKGWESIRMALLSKQHKYMAVVNNFGDCEETQDFLREQGAMNIKSVYSAFNQHLDEKDRRRIEGGWQTEGGDSISEDLSTVIKRTQLSKVDSIYPENYVQMPSSNSSEDTEDYSSSNVQEMVESAQMMSIDPKLNEVDPENSRIVRSNVDLSVLYQYVPATKIKGVSDYVLESEYYQHYEKGQDFSIQVSEETVLPIPKYLNAYAFAADDHTRFPAPKISSTNVLNYYLFDGASILPVLALDLKAGDVVLDMCAAPGGKSLAIIQTLAPKYLILNDLMESRLNRIRNVLDQFTKGFEDSGTNVILTQEDARYIEEKGVYDKILVDVPCTTDRHSLHTDENNIFKPTRIKERLRIPDLQTDILTNALRLIKIGGTVVYSTCTLSPIQNDGVVQLALKRIWEEENSKMVVKNMSRALKPLYPFFKFDDAHLRYGHIAIPTTNNNWGPMYFCKIVRVE